MVAEHEFDDATQFLSPILWPADVQRRSNGSLSIADALLSNDHADITAQASSTSRLVVERVLSHLQAIYASLAKADNAQHEIENLFQTPEYQRVIDTLLDLLSVEGIYAYFLPGVGVPIEKRMRFVTDKYDVAVQRSTGVLPRDSLIDQAIELLVAISGDDDLSLIVFQRNIVDLLAIMFQYAYMPEAADPEVKSKLEATIPRVPLDNLYPSLTALMHPAAPTWMKTAVLPCLARLPMRKNGVRATLLFLSTAQGSSSLSNQQQSSQSQFLTQELLDRLVKVVCSVPKSVDPDQWFRNMAQQLLSMLDDQNKDNQSVASYVLGAVLSRRSIGAPGTPGWRYIAEPILSDVRCDQYMPSDSQDKGSLNHSSPLELAIERLDRLLTSHPNPGLVKRICSRVLLPLWALACGPGNQAELGSAAGVRVLKAYFRAMGTQAVLSVLDSIEYDGSPSTRIDWVRSEHWRPTLVRRTEPHVSTSLMQSLERISVRVEILINFLGDTESGELSELCIAVIRKWMSNEHQLSTTAALQENPPKPSDGAFVYLKFLQSMLERFSPILASSPTQFVPLVVEMLSSFLKSQASPPPRGPVRLTNIANIAQQQSLRSKTFDDALSMVEISLGLLAILLNDEKQFMSVTERPVCMSLKSTLEQLTHQTALPSDVLQPARVLLDQLSEAMGLGAVSSQEGKRTEPDDNVRHRTALNNISDPNPPIRAEGLADLRKLIAKSSNTISVPSTVIMLEGLLRDDDEYTHLAAITTLVALGAHNPSKTLEQLMIMFVDPSEESTVDVRLKLAEAMQRIAKQDHTELDELTATRLVESAVLVSGRRPERAKEASRRAKDRRLQERRNQASRSSGSRIRLAEDNDREEVTPADELAAKLLQDWAGSGREEDIRVRTSAIAILDVVLGNAFSSLPQSSIEAALEITLNVLRQEKDEGAAILRRSAILCLQTLVTQANNNVSRKARISLDAQLLDDALACLEDIISDETDEIARGHAMAVKSAIEEDQRDALNVKLRGEDIRFDLGGHLRGLDVNPETSGKPRPGIEEIE